MKGQISIEYYVSLMFFVSLVTYLFLRMIALTPSFLEQIRRERIYSEAYQISEILINDPGEPPTWDENNVKRIGLQDESIKKLNYVSSDKISKLKSICQSDEGYQKIKRKLGVDEDLEISINVSEENNLLVSCYPDKIPSRSGVSISRIISIDGKKYGRVVVSVW